MNGYHIFSLKKWKRDVQKVSWFFFSEWHSVMYIIYQNLKKKFWRPDYLQIQFVKKTFTLLFNTEIIYRDQTLIKFVY